MPMAYSYIRFSTPKQARGHGERRQRDAAIAYAARLGLQIDTTLSMADRGISAFTGANKLYGALAAFMVAVDHGRIPRGSILIVEAIDRLSRETPFQAMDTIKKITDAGIAIHTIQDGMIYSSDTIETTFETLAQKIHGSFQYSKLLEMRVTEGWESKRNNLTEGGKPVSKICPGWLRVVGGKYEKLPDRVAIVQRIFHESMSGMGCVKIARGLNAEGIPTFNKHGQGIDQPWITDALWQPSYIKIMTHNRAVLGFYQPHKRKKIDGKKIRVPTGNEVKIYPTIIDIVTFEKVNAARATKKPGRKGIFSNLLSGLGKCDECGGPMTFRSVGNPRTRYLKCNRAFRHIGSCTNVKNYRYDNIEAIVLRSLIKFGVVGGDFLSLDSDGAAISRKIALLGEDATQKRKQLGNWEQAMNEAYSAFAAKKVQELETDLERLGKEITTLKSSAALNRGTTNLNHLAQLQKYFFKVELQTGDPIERAKVYQALLGLVESIIFKQDSILVFFKGGSVSIHISTSDYKISGVVLSDEDTSIAFTKDGYAVQEIDQSENPNFNVETGKAVAKRFIEAMGVEWID